MTIKRSWVAVALILAAGLPSRAAHADCIAAEVRVWTSGSSTPAYPIGQERCVQPTPWNTAADFGLDDREWWVPTGLPNGVGFTVWVTAP